MERRSNMTLKRSGMLAEDVAGHGGTGDNMTAPKVDATRLKKDLEDLGKQGTTERLFHKIPAEAVVVLADVMTYGSNKRGQDPYAFEEGWRAESYLFHFNKAMGHMLKFIMRVKDREDHLGAAFCRLGQAIATRPKEDDDDMPKL
jgi:hypothetical protein